MISDQKLEAQFLRSLADLSSYDIPEAKKWIETNHVSDADFSSVVNHQLFCSVRDCIAANLPANFDNLIRSMKGGVDTLYDVSPAHVANFFKIEEYGPSLEGYWKQLVACSERRSTAKLLEEAIQDVTTGRSDPSDVRFRLSARLQRTRGTKQTRGLDEYVDDVENHVGEVISGKVKKVLPWGIDSLDENLGGLQPTLILIGAEPGVGKSALIASAVSRQAKLGNKPFVASLEDEPSWLAWRLVSDDSQLNQFDLRYNHVTKEAFGLMRGSNDALREERKRIRVCDGSISGIRIEDLVSTMNDAILNEGCDSIWIDHLGEILLTSSERTDLEITRHLSLLRRSSRGSLPVIILSNQAEGA